ncbi:inositol phospholipid synthesis and fat-storage-inducing TM-domain-containing protein [Hypoxylon sp. FL1284]|nr:inositol phospholipid synthesis and fat-storage-inducing TM-domain-containing protein [Hypoxylon sp. FL1284]
MIDDDNSTPSLRSRQKQAKMAGSSGGGSDRDTNGSSPRPATTTTSSSSATATKRTSPYLPTPTETLALAAYPALLAFGTVFSAVSPETRDAPYDAGAQSHAAGAAPSYFARKDNVVNVVFVKRGWAWVSAALVAFVLTHRAFRAYTRRGNGNGNGNGGEGGWQGAKVARAAIRGAIVTGWWALVTQWCFGPPLIDRGFRFTGGRCEVAVEAVAEGVADSAEVLTAAACRAAGGRWRGGHDISGHVFLLVLGSFFLLQEVGWVLRRAGVGLGTPGGGVQGEERCVVMADGAVKGAGVEAEELVGEEDEEERRQLGFGGRFALSVVALCYWMLLMTAIYFHTWFEKLTGLLVAFMAIYPVYILPRWLPPLRALIGLPGI